MLMSRVSNFKKLRWSAVILGVLNMMVIILGIIIITLVYPTCRNGDIFPFLVVVLVSCVRIIAMIRTAIAQLETANLVLKSHGETPIVDALMRHERRKRYRRWLCWTRFATIITVLQLLGATHLLFHVGKHTSADQTSSSCALGILSKSKWHHNVFVLFVVMVCFVALLQCLTGPDVLRWRSFYSTQDNAWKAHYSEVFDHGIREALCCLGRIKYLTVLEEDEVHSVAQLLGDLVAYRASGTGHLELLAGLALLQRYRQPAKVYEEYVEAPLERIEEAVTFHPFAEAAYTGLLLDVGRNPVLFPCAWLYRQGVLTPWTRNRRPALEGDNWWRGHAAAFLKYVNLSPEVLRRGRVNQAKCEAAYFVVVLHDLKSVVIVVRGTETPEDLITDGLCRECSLTTEDLDGLINGGHIQPSVKKTMLSSLQHYGHSGIVDAARDLFMQIEGYPYDGNSSESGGFLNSLLGVGCECEGYNVRIVGHSLGGSIATLLGLRLYRRYPNLHVFTYGPLPCVDLATADACSEFVTSIVYQNEFSSRLSAASIMRLRASAIMALSQDGATDSTMVLKLARRFLFMSDHLRTKDEKKMHASDTEDTTKISNLHIDGNHLRNDRGKELDKGFPLWQDMEDDSSDDKSDSSDSPNSFTDSGGSNSLVDVNSYHNPVSQFMEAMSSSRNRSSMDLPEMFLPGLVIHIVPQKNSFQMSLWKCLRTREECSYKAYIANREVFKDIIVSQSMFLDHLPWRCHFAMRKALESRNLQDQINNPQIP
ncbi:hypothetical protein LguiA_029680 [Lonicera macranthoides]